MVVSASISATARMLRAVCILSTLLLLATSTATASATSATAAAPAPAAKTNPNSDAAKPAVKPDVKPLWTDLTAAQQKILLPLAPEWNKVDGNHKAKWLAISNKFSTMTPEKQQRLQENIRDWAKLTPEQHRIARESYARTKKLNAEQKASQWQQYQQLPSDQKQKLAADAVAKKRIVNLPNTQSKTKIVEPLKSTRNVPVAPALHATSQPTVPGAMSSANAHAGTQAAAQATTPVPDK